MALSYIQELDRILLEANRTFQVENQTGQLQSVKKENECEDAPFSEENQDNTSAGVE